MCITFVIYYILVVVNLGVELPVNGTMPKHAGARSVYIKGAFTGAMNEQFNSIKILTINNMKISSMCILDFSVKIYFINSSPKQNFLQKIKYCLILTTIM